MFYIISKNNTQRCLVFPRNRKNCQNLGFLGCCNGKTYIYDEVNLGTNTRKFIWNLFYKKNVFIICVLSAIQVFPKTTLKNKFDCPTMTLLCTICLPQDILHVKRPKLSEYQQIGSLVREGWGFCKSQIPESEWKCTLITTRLFDFIKRLFSINEQWIFHDGSS